MEVIFSKEVWKPVLGYEEYYAVSNMGRVKSKDRIILKSNGITQHRKERIKIPQLDSDGYLRVGICVNGSNIKKCVHHLVAEAFVPGYFDGAEVNHKDFNRTNNCSENLEWVTHASNVEYAVKSGRHILQCANISGENNPNFGNHKLHEKYAADKEYSIKKQSRPGARNGRAVGVTIVFADSTEMYFGCMTDCAQYLIDNNFSKSSNKNNISANISKARKTGNTFLGLLFK